VRAADNLGAAFSILKMLRILTGRAMSLDDKNPLERVDPSAGIKRRKNKAISLMDALADRDQGASGLRIDALRGGRSPN
jgi:hypothetical protein